MKILVKSDILDVVVGVEVDIPRNLIDLHLTKKVVLVIRTKIYLVSIGEKKRNLQAQLRHHLLIQILKMMIILKMSHGLLMILYGYLHLILQLIVILSIAIAKHHRKN